MADVTFGSDGDFSDRALVYKVNANLANELGNLCQRVLTLVYKNCQKAVPVNVGPLSEQDEALLASARGLREKAAEAISVQAIQKYVEILVAMVWDANKYIDEMEPWVLRKTDPERMATVLYVLMEVLRYTAILYQPVIPGSANQILDLLTVPTDERTFAHLNDEYQIRPGSLVSKPQGVFPRLELPSEELVEA